MKTVKRNSMKELLQKYIEKLDGNTLPILLNKLIRAECTASNIPLNSAYCTLPDRVCIKDGGADAVLNNLTKNTDFLFSNNMVFQVKATPSFDLRKEVDKIHIREHIKTGGAYVLFCNKLHCEGYNAVIKENEFKEQIVETLSISAKNVNFRLYDHSKIASWVDKYYPVKIWLLRTIGEFKDIFEDFEIWQLDRSLQNPLKTNSNIEKSIKDISDIICSNSIIRIEGQSGIGKTRQLLEAVRMCKDIQDLVLYTKRTIDCFQDICNVVNFLIREKQEAFIVLDDCPFEEFTKIKDMLNRFPNNITFVSLDYETENNENKKSLISYERINLLAADNEVIEAILKDKYKNVDETYLQHLTEWCGHNPRMAIILNNGFMDFSRQSEELERMIKPHRIDEATKNLSNVLEVCSLFKNIYYSQEDDSELLKLASLAGLSEVETIKCFNKLKNTLGVIQKRYEYHYVIPKILAFRMIFSWLDDSTSIQRNKLKELPDRMKQSCYEQLACLNEYPQIRSLAEKLIVPFAEREMLNSKFGAECFLRLSNIVPAIALRQLQETFSSFSHDDYLNLEKGRRAIVRSLQVIAFHKEHFNEAAEIMLSLADAENENWGNNATGEFIGFFKLYLGGTTCPAINRLPVIRRTLSNKEDINKIRICLQALDKALTFGHFVRSSGPEKQGAIKLEDWKPKTTYDVQIYVAAVLDILQNIIYDESFPLRQYAKDIIGQNLRMVLQHTNIDDIVSRLIGLVEFDDSGWEKARISLNHFYKFDIDKLEINSDDIKKIDKLDNILSPHNLAEKIRSYIISKANWNFYHGEKSDEEFVDENAQLLINDEDTLKLLISDLNENNNYHIFLLGKKLAEYLPDDKIKQIIDNSVDTIKSIQETKLLNGCSFLSGLLSGVNDEKLIDNYIKTWNSTRETAILILMSSRGLKRSHFRYTQLIDVINKYDWDEYLYFYTPLVGRCSYIEEYEDVFNLVTSLGKKDNKGSLQAIIQILHSILCNNKEIPKILMQITSDITNDWILLKQVGNNGLYEYECKELWNYCYDNMSDDKKYSTLSKMLQHLADRDENDTFLKYYVSDLIKEKLEKQDILTLQAIFDYCSMNDYNFIYFNVYLSNNFGSKEKSYIDNFSWDILKSFINKSKEFGLFVAKNTALFEKDSLSNNFKNILKNYINDEEMMSALRSNIYNFSWTGEVSNYYLKVKKVLTSFSEGSDDCIKNWIDDTIKELDNDIKRERRNEELFKLGIL